jgi:hypothetical protein
MSIVNSVAAIQELSLDRIMEAVESGENLGFCTECGDEVDGVEPDARKHTFPECGVKKVYGASELLIMGVGC